MNYTDDEFVQMAATLLIASHPHGDADAPEIGSLVWQEAAQGVAKFLKHLQGHGLPLPPLASDARARTATSRLLCRIKARTTANLIDAAHIAANESTTA